MASTVPITQIQTAIGAMTDDEIRAWGNELGRMTAALTQATP